MNSRLTTSLVLQILRRSRSSGLCFSTAFSSQAIVRRSGTTGRRSILGVDAWERSFGSASPELAKADADAAEKEKSIAETVNREVGSRPDTGAVVSSYWGIRPSKITREDGTVWPWNCFRVGQFFCSMIFPRVLSLQFSICLCLCNSPSPETLFVSLSLERFTAFGYVYRRSLDRSREASCAEDVLGQSCLSDG